MLFLATLALLAMVACTMFLIYEVYKFRHFWHHRTSQVLMAVDHFNQRFEQERQQQNNVRHEQSPLAQDERFVPTTVFCAEPTGPYDDERHDEDGYDEDGYDEDDNVRDDEAVERTENLHDE